MTDSEADGKGWKNAKSGAGISENSSRDDYILRLQAELEQLKEQQGIASSSYRMVQSQSPVSKKKNSPYGQKVCSHFMLCIEA